MTYARRKEGMVYLCVKYVLYVALLRMETYDIGAWHCAIHRGYTVKTVSYRMDESVLALVDTLKIRGFGTSATDVVKKAIVFSATAKPGELAEAWVAWLASGVKEEAAPAVVVKEEAPVVAAEPEPACEVCGDQLAAGNSRFCAAHRPAIED